MEYCTADFRTYQTLSKTANGYQTFYSYKCGKNVNMTIAGNGKGKSRDWISTAGEVKNPDFGYAFDNIRGRV